MDFAIRAHDTNARTTTGLVAFSLQLAHLSSLVLAPTPNNVSRPSDMSVPPAAMGCTQEEEEEEEEERWTCLVTGGDNQADPLEQELFMANQDELQTARISQPAEPQSRPIRVASDV